MLKQIQRDDLIFQSDLFLKDSMAFCLVQSILNNKEVYPDAKVFSNNSNCAIVNSDPEHPVIVWTSDDFCAYEELYHFIKKEFYENSPFKIMSKKKFYDCLVENQKIPKSNIQTLGVYSCSKLNDLQYLGHMDHAKPDEIEEVAEMLVKFEKETGENPDAQLSDYIQTAHEFLSNPTYAVWRDEDEKIVSIGVIRLKEKYPRIGRVYTKQEARGKSYAKMIVHALTLQALKDGKQPMLFTDYDYEPSNRCYRSIGYELKCTIVNFEP